MNIFSRIQARTIPARPTGMYYSMEKDKDEFHEGDLGGCSIKWAFHDRTNNDKTTMHGIGVKVSDTATQTMTNAIEDMFDQMKDKMMHQFMNSDENYLDNQGDSHGN